METTKVVTAQPKSKSLRTTIPASIARQFGIVAGSELGWEFRVEDNSLIIVVYPIEPLEKAGPATPTPKRRKTGR
jgi:bifunctional DNA-binding transcriptional regulator/antitoxin component of YhaV-PrlF toxin-antitoxin module